jgi:polyhydroxyalkanoate synthase
MSSDVALAGQIFREMTGDIFKRNLLAKGELKIAGRQVDLQNIKCPLLNVVADLDDVVHPSSSLPLPEKVGSADRRNLTFATGHIGAVVSAGAIKKLWPEVGGWLADRDQ